MKVDRTGRLPFRQNLQTARLNSLLLFLGIPRKELYVPKNRLKPVGTLWQRNEGRLDFLLHDAHRAYRESIKACHPDKGGCAKRAASLNQAWQRVKKLFAQKGVKLD